MATIETFHFNAPNTSNHVEVRIEGSDNTIRFNAVGGVQAEVSLPFTFRHAVAVALAVHELALPEKYAQFLSAEVA